MENLLHNWAQEPIKMVIATLENEAHGLFSDPPWMKVFKTTYDSLYDHLIKVNQLVAGSKYIKSLFQT